MSTPHEVKCGCGRTFMFLRGSLTDCPNCGEPYQSHRDSIGIPRIAELSRLAYYFNSITCYVAEGPEFHSREFVLELILKEAKKGHKLTQELIQKEREE